jgi:ribose transport system permease protein
MRNSANRLLTLLLNYSTVLLLIAVFAAFELISPRPFIIRDTPPFIIMDTIVNILVQSSSVGIVAVGMTFVLLTAGIDLSVGSIMFVTAILGGLAINGGSAHAHSFALVLAAGFAVSIVAGLAFGAINAFFVTGCRVIPFVVTLATLYAGRGLGLRLTQTQSLAVGGVRGVGTGDVLTVTVGGETYGLPFALFLFLLVLVAGHIVLTQTPFGRRIYAIGNDAEAAKKAGINTRRVLFVVYVISGACAALAGILTSWQLANVSPSFGEQREFEAIAAAVLGGTSLFGGRGRVFPGTVLGAVLIQTVQTGLTAINANEYVYPIITSGVIFFAVFIDSIRFARLQKIKRRRIRVEQSA